MPWALALGASLLLASETAFGAAVFFFAMLLPKTVLGDERAMRVIALLLDLPAPTARPRDADGQLCEAAFLFRHHFKAFMLPTGKAKRSFHAACRRVVALLDSEARTELDRLLRTEGALTRVLQEEPANPEGGHAVGWRACGARFGRKTEGVLEGAARELHAKKGILPLRERVIDASDVPEALARAEVALFDARGMLPARMFNVSLQELQARGAADVGVHVASDGRHGIEDISCAMFFHLATVALTHRGPGSLFEWLLEHGLTEAALRNLCHRPWTLGEFAAAASGTFENARYSPADSAQERHAFVELQGALAKSGRATDGANVNLLRLPNWTRGEADLPSLVAAMGLGDHVEHAHSLLWLGASSGGVHSDIQDNVLVQLSGTSDAFLVPANCSLALSLGMDVAYTPVTADWIQEQGPDFPFFLITLKPGDGLVIPSNTAHTVTSRETGRVGLNFFFEPRYGRMQWHEAPASFFNYASKSRLAMRSLWVKTVKDMWEHGGVGASSFIVHGQRQELV